jgi:hypothetical protein
MRAKLTLIAILFSFILIGCEKENFTANHENQLYESAKPYTRWWWFASVIKNEDIKHQLDWLKEQGFGGVEIAFIYPVNREPKAPRIGWLSQEWTDAVTYAKRYCDTIGFGCDFTFGTLWPFGGTFVSDYDRTKIWGDSNFMQPHRLSWSHPDTGNVLNHMSQRAFNNYAKIMGNALKPALMDYKSAIFCDSWEVETKYIWTDYFDFHFRLKYGYDINKYMKDIYKPDNKGALYDYMKLVSEMVIKNFYIPFTDKAHDLGSYSRAQVSGAPVDLISGYSAIDIPETEAMLYEPNFSRIVASSAALSNKNIVSAETFTCLYGWPREHHLEEQTADLKLVCDALFANGTNQIIWHGYPYNPIGSDSILFYATVHVGEKGTLKPELKSFNKYMEEVSKHMRKGRTYSDIAVYLPTEDAWIAGEYPPEKQMKWSWGQYEMRYVHFPKELKGYHPLWINNDFLKKAVIKNGKMYIDDLCFSALYLDVNYLDYEALLTLYNMALNNKDFPIVLKGKPEQAGLKKSSSFNKKLNELKSFYWVHESINQIKIPKLFVEGFDYLEYWCRKDKEDLYIFVSNPRAWNLTYPMKYGQSYQSANEIYRVKINYDGKIFAYDLTFDPYQSILLKINKNGIENIDIRFLPKSPKLVSVMK